MMHKYFTLKREKPSHSWVLKEERLKIKELTAFCIITEEM